MDCAEGVSLRNSYLRWNNALQSGRRTSTFEVDDRRRSQPLELHRIDQELRTKFFETSSNPQTDTKYAFGAIWADPEFLIDSPPKPVLTVAHQLSGGDWRKTKRHHREENKSQEQKLNHPPYKDPEKQLAEYNINGGYKTVSNERL